MRRPSNGLSLPRSTQGSNRRRARRAASLALYGGALGVASLFVSLLAQTEPPDEPEHLSPTVAVILSGGAFLAGAILASVIVYWAGSITDEALNPLWWAIFGFAFGVLVPFFTGMLMPVNGVFLNLKLGIIAPSELFSAVLDSVFRAPSFAFSHGTLGLFTGILAGLLFGVGGWVIDVVNASANPRSSRYGAVAITTSLSAAIVAVAVLASPSFLANFG